MSEIPTVEQSNPDIPEDVTSSSVAALAAAATAPEGGLGDYGRNWVQRVRGGETGSMPAVAGLVILSILFWSLHSSFGSLGNLANLIDQAAATIFIAMGLVFVLLLGEIDLAAGTAGGVCAAVMARLSVGYNWPWPATILSAMVTGVVIGLLTGWLCAKIRIPSFVVTLALFLAFQGVVLYVVNNGAGTHGNLTISDKFIVALDNGEMANWAGWLLLLLLVLGYAAQKIWAVTQRRRAGLSAEPMTVVAVKVIALTLISALTVFLLNKNRAPNAGETRLINQGGKLVRVSVPGLSGVPWAVPVILFFFVVLSFVLGRTRYGRHVYAVGGNTEAARRAGIATDRIRISVFAINSLMASIGGIFLASQVRSVDQGEGGGNVLLLAVGAAVIGGTSLFGGRGRPFDAVIGGLVLAVIANGMSDLVQGDNGAAVQYIVTGAVLLLAAAFDAILRRRAGASGLA
jgi:D-xylose transport system permease protein